MRAFRSFRLMLLTCWMLCAVPAWAEWLAVFEQSDAVYYIDTASILKDGNLRKVWSIKNLKQRDKDGAMSYQIRSGYDCKEQRRWILSVSSRSAPMAGGKVIHAGKPNSEWNDMPSAGGFEVLMKVVCGKVG